MGCAKTYLTDFVNQSHFDYPNSNIIPIGNTTGEASLSTFITPAFKTSELEEEAINNALKKKAGDILLNYMVFEKQTNFLLFNTLTLRVEGVAAKMEIGTIIME